MSWFLKVVRDNYANFNGRAQRKEFWMYTLFCWLIFLILGLYLQTTVDDPEVGDLEIGVIILMAALWLPLLIPSLAVSVRRFHDIGKSGWWFLVCLSRLLARLFGLFLCVLMTIKARIDLVKTPGPPFKKNK